MSIESGNIRSRAIDWFERKYGCTDRPIISSKLYKPSESWTKDFVWFVQLPLQTLEEKKHGAFNILLQKEIGSEDFYYLKVPGYFLIQHLPNFDRIKDSIGLYFSPKLNNKFCEIRGKKPTEFKNFLQGQ